MKLSIAKRKAASQQDSRGTTALIPATWLRASDTTAVAAGKYESRTYLVHVTTTYTATQTSETVNHEALFKC